MSLRLRADENVPWLLVEALRSRGHEVVTVQEIAPSIPDHRVVSLTRSQNRLLLAFDKGLRRLLRLGSSWSGCARLLLRR